MMLQVSSWEAFAIEPGETFEYHIKKMGLNVGTAVFEYKGKTTIEGQPAIYVKVTAKGFQFYDEENIYLDETTYLPYLVKRNLDIFGKKETITEHYNQNEGYVEIEGRKEDQESGEITKIELNGVVDNIYGFIYRYRLRGKFEPGEKMVIQLPTRKVTLKLIGEKELKVGGEKVSAYYMEDTEQKIKVWFGEKEDRIPYRINGAIGFGNTSLVIKKSNNLNLSEDKGEE